MYFDFKRLLLVEEYEYSFVYEKWEFYFILWYGGKLAIKRGQVPVSPDTCKLLRYRNSKAAHPGSPLKSYKSHTRVDVAAELAKNCRNRSCSGYMSQSSPKLY